MSRTLAQLTRIASLGMFCGVLLSYALWRSVRFYPLTPVFGAPISFGAFDHVLILLLAGACFLNFLFPARSNSALICVFISLFWALDQSRLQPWTLLFAGMLALGFLPLSAKAAVDMGVCILCAVYLWSGLHKFNLRFVSLTFPWVLQPLGFSYSHPRMLAALSLLVPVLESLMAPLFVFARTRTLGLFLICGMHLCLLSALGPFGHAVNTVVWPWNVAMACFALLLWRGTWGREIDLAALLKNWCAAPLLALFVMFPLFNFFGWWDAYPSFSLYTEITPRAYVNFDPTSLNDLPHELKAGVISDQGDRETPTKVSLNNWSFAELNVPAYPSARVYRAIFRELCRRRIGARSLEIQTFSRVSLNPRFERQVCD